MNMNIEPTTISLVDVTWLYIHLQKILKIVPMLGKFLDIHKSLKIHVSPFNAYNLVI